MFMVILGLIAGASFAYVKNKIEEGHTAVGGTTTRGKDDPLTVLVLGSDSRAGLSAEELKKYDPEGQDRGSGRRADTIMLLHIDPKRQKAILISFPRDLKVTYLNGKSGRINAMYQKGPTEMVKLVARYTGLPINHYIEVNFAGFKNIVDTLGGIDVFFEKPIREKDSGLNVPKGCVHLEGDQALAFVRIRKVDSDFGRIARQQLFMRLMMDKITSAGTILNPIKLTRLVDLFSKNVTRDAELDLDAAKSLALKLRNFDSSSVDMRFIPSSSKSIGGTSYVIEDKQQTEAIFKAISEEKPLPDYGKTEPGNIPPSEIRVTVLNGAGAADSATVKKTQSDMKAKSFVVMGVGTASPHETTTVYYVKGHHEKAGMVAGLLGAKITEMPASIEVPSEIAIVLGSQPTAAPSQQPSTPKATKSSAPPAKTPVPKPLARRCDG